MVFSYYSMIPKRANSICGIDEVGRGALAGPLLAAGVVLTPRALLALKEAACRIGDSKTLSPLQRKHTYDVLRQTDATIIYATISVEDINAKGIQEANYQSVRTIISSLHADEFIVDGNLDTKRLGSKNISSVIRADSNIIEVMLASIMAKVTRDAYMENIHMEFPRYVWKQNKGYGTRAHLWALHTFGPNKHHRSAFIHL
jgi:ribonuclease HII